MALFLDSGGSKSHMSDEIMPREAEEPRWKVIESKGRETDLI